MHRVLRRSACFREHTCSSSEHYSMQCSLYLGSRACSSPASKRDAAVRTWRPRALSSTNVTARWHNPRTPIRICPLLVPGARAGRSLFVPVCVGHARVQYRHPHTRTPHMHSDSNADRQGRQRGHQARPAGNQKKRLSSFRRGQSRNITSGHITRTYTPAAATLFCETLRPLIQPAGRRSRVARA